MASRRQAVSDILENLSNNEIRQRLILHGYPSISVTEQNRTLLLETLRQYIDAEQRQYKLAQPNLNGAKGAGRNGPNTSDSRAGAESSTVTHITPNLDPVSTTSESSPRNQAIAGSIIMGGAAALLVGLVYFHSLVAT